MASVLGALKRGFEALPLKGRGKSSRRSGLRPRRRPCGKAVGGVAPTYGVRGNSGQAFVGRQRDRKSAVQGRSVYVRVDLGGRRIINKQKDVHTETIAINKAQ